MRPGGPGAKPKYGYIAITFSQDAICGGAVPGGWGQVWGPLSGRVGRKWQEFLRANLPKPAKPFGHRRHGSSEGAAFAAASSASMSIRLRKAARI